MNSTVPSVPPASRREIFSWAMYDFANSGFTTVVYTAVFSVYFVGVVAGAGERGMGTVLWTIAMAITNLLVLSTAPVLGAIADQGAHKKRFLALTTIGCVLFTAALGFVGAGDVVLGIVLVVLAGVMFASGENFIAAFLPEIANENNIARISGYGWSLGFIGGITVLVLSLAYIQWAQAHGQTATQFVPVTMWITAGVFAIAALPTFLGLRERALPQARAPGESYLRVGFARVRHTFAHARHYRDLFRFLITLAVYHCGVSIVVVLFAVYTQQVMGFSQSESIGVLIAANITAAVGALCFGIVQDRMGSVRTLATTLCLWVVALVLTTLCLWVVALVFASQVESRIGFWIAANVAGLALGASQSAGRALVGKLSPPARSAEFFGLWGLAGKLAAVVGPLTYGLLIYLSHGNQRMALLATSVFFIAGLALLLTVDERRGRAAALEQP
jgi:MFS transporter, UMF1 family